MKLLTIAVPCYNSAAYMSRCIDSLLPGGEEVEILVIDDGSKDDTLKVAQEYEAKYPGIVKAIHQENKGHGGAVNTGIENASGLFFKVCDSDDWFKQEAYLKVLEVLAEMVKSQSRLDMLIANYVYEKEGEKHKKVMHQRRTLPQNEIFKWEDCGHFKKGHYILMHSVIFRTRVLLESGLKLPEHTFYVDNLYVFEPLPFVKYMYYMDVNLYRYYIGRSDQSVNEEVMMGRVDQQLRVNYRMIDYLKSVKPEIQKQKRLYQYMRNYLEIITAISSILLIRINTKDSLKQKKELWKYIKKSDSKLWGYMRAGLLGNGTNLPGKGGRKLTVAAYHIAQKVFGFN